MLYGWRRRTIEEQVHGLLIFFFIRWLHRNAVISNMHNVVVGILRGGRSRGARVKSLATALSRCRGELFGEYFGIPIEQECGICDVCRRVPQRPVSFFDPIRKSREDRNKRSVRKKAARKKGSGRRRGRRRGRGGQGRRTP